MCVAQWHSTYLAREVLHFIPTSKEPKKLLRVCRCPCQPRAGISVQNHFCWELMWVDKDFLQNREPARVLLVQAFEALGGCSIGPALRKLRVGLVGCGCSGQGPASGAQMKTLTKGKERKCTPVIILLLFQLL